MIQSDYAPAYANLAEPDRQTIYRALALLKASIVGPVLNCPKAVMDYLTLKYADLQQEVFGVLWLDAQNRLQGEDVLFHGTLTQTAVYPREVARHGLLRNAAGVVVFHNHPSGCPEPSRADDVLTSTLQQTLLLVDIKLIDHIVVSTGGAVSLAERDRL